MSVPRKATSSPISTRSAPLPQSATGILGIKHQEVRKGSSVESAEGSHCPSAASFRAERDYHVRGVGEQPESTAFRAQAGFPSAGGVSPARLPPPRSQTSFPARTGKRQRTCRKGGPTVAHCPQDTVRHSSRRCSVLILIFS